jgi:hypothetical protein
MWNDHIVHRGRRSVSCSGCSILGERAFTFMDRRLGGPQSQIGCGTKKICLFRTEYWPTQENTLYLRLRQTHIQQISMMNIMFKGYRTYRAVH